MRILLFLLALGACSDNLTPYGPDGGPPATIECLPNLDGELVRGEMPTLLDTAVDYLIAEDTTVDLSSNSLEMREEIAGEGKLAFVATALSDQWFASEFPYGSIVVPLDLQGQKLAVLRSAPEAVRLLGIASQEPDYTLLHYLEPIDLYRFPIFVGQNFAMESPVVGTLAAVPYNGSDRYEISVNAIASVALPHLRFTSAYRIHTQVTSDSGAAGVVITRQELSLVSECFGEVARVISQDNETSANFTNAAELWRFSL